ncbi:domain-containing 3-like [Octopus vulgaris]|uniref:Domain-containing 3-like n=1 Tax=Octopus vulgaris TaxID=6645 RepID=A0AA36ALY7_OCTVU|nr:domain-containing 3-like [Octopus vulgaris]
MSEPTAKKAKLRNYKKDFIMFGFISVDSKPMCLECDAIMTNHSMKKVKLEQHQKLRHLLSVGKGKEYFENKKKIQLIKLPDFVKKINTEKAKILKPGYLVSEVIAKVAAPQIYGEKLVKSACANEVLRKYAASTQSTILLSNNTITRRQDEMSNFVEEDCGNSPKDKFFTIHNQAILLVYVRFIHEDDIKEKRLFIQSLSETTNGENIFNEVMQYFNDKNIPLTNLINIASDGAAAMTGKVKGFVSRMKSVAPHIFYIHCIIHRQHLVAKNIGRHMEEALNTVIHAINFVKSNSVNNRFFMQFCEDEDFKTLLLHTEVRWLSKDLSLERLVNLWEPLINFLMFKSQMIPYKIFYLSDIFRTVNLLNLELQGRKSDLVTCSQKIKG